MPTPGWQTAYRHPTCSGAGTLRAMCVCKTHIPCAALQGRNSRMLHQVADSLQAPQTLEQLQCSPACFSDIARCHGPSAFAIAS